MNHRDIWFVGLLALAYLYLDASAPGARREALVHNEPMPPPPDTHGEDALPFLPNAGCPRDLTHAIRVRGDGAKWCLACDEAFYPAVMVI